MSSKQKIHIVGAGFSGLACAHYCLKKGYLVEVWEKNHQWGGMINTIHSPHGRVETAAPGLTYNAWTEDLFNELNLNFIPSKKKRYIFYEKLKRWPFKWQDIGVLVSFLLRWFFSDLQPRSNETVREWGQKNLNTNITENFLSPILQKYYALDIDQLSASLVFNEFFAAKSRSPQRKTRGFVIPEEGMKELIETWVEFLLRRGCSFRMGEEFQLSCLKKDEAVILATGIHQAGQLLSDVSPELSQNMQNQEMLPLYRVSLHLTYSHFVDCEVLLDRRAQLTALAMTGSVGESPHSKTVETWLLRPPAKMKNFSDQAIVDLVMSDRDILTRRASKSLLYSQVVRWDEAIPAYDISLENFLKNLKLPRGVYLCGNYLMGLDLSNLLVCAEETAKKISQEFS